jgi:hypothetical protein
MEATGETRCAGCALKSLLLSNSILLFNFFLYNQGRNLSESLAPSFGQSDGFKTEICYSGMDF